MTGAQLPPPRRPGATYQVVLVCLGNICRSPIAEVVLSDKLATAGLDGSVGVTSAGTGDWHMGDPMDRRAAALLTTHGYDASRHRAARFERELFDADLVLAMDAANLADLTDRHRHGEVDPARMRMFRDFDPRSDSDQDRDVPDPYFGGDDGFATVLAIAERTCDALVTALDDLVSAPTTRSGTSG